MNTTLPDDDRDRQDVEHRGDHQDSLLGWPLGALLIVGLIAVVAVVVTRDAVTAMLMAGFGGVAVLVLDKISD